MFSSLLASHSRSPNANAAGSSQQDSKESAPIAESKHHVVSARKNTFPYFAGRKQDGIVQHANNPFSEKYQALNEEAKSFLTADQMYLKGEVIDAWNVPTAIARLHMSTYYDAVEPKALKEVLCSYGIGTVCIRLSSSRYFYELVSCVGPEVDLQYVYLPTFYGNQPTGKVDVSEFMKDKRVVLYPLAETMPYDQLIINIRKGLQEHFDLPEVHFLEKSAMAILLGRLVPGIPNIFNDYGSGPHYAAVASTEVDLFSVKFPDHSGRQDIIEHNRAAYMFEHVKARPTDSCRSITVGGETVFCAFYRDHDDDPTNTSRHIKLTHKIGIVDLQGFLEGHVRFYQEKNWMSSSIKHNTEEFRAFLKRFLSIVKDENQYLDFTALHLATTAGLSKYKKQHPQEINRPSVLRLESQMNNLMKTEQKSYDASLRMLTNELNTQYKETDRRLQGRWIVGQSRSSLVQFQVMLEKILVIAPKYLDNSHEHAHAPVEQTACCVIS